MKIVFNVKEDDPRNPGVIADCTGDNAGDSVGPTADGFETYGVTGVALISFIVLAIPETAIRPASQADRVDFRHAVLDGLHVRRVLLHQPGDFREASIEGLKEFNFEVAADSPDLDRRDLCISTSFFMSWLLIGDLVVADRAMPSCGGSWPRSLVAELWPPC